jgi:hypothetical protein
VQSRDFGKHSLCQDLQLGFRQRKGRLHRRGLRAAACECYLAARRRLRSIPEISNLRIVSAFECKARGTALDVGRQTLVA